jgi:hypothetical protein
MDCSSLPGFLEGDLPPEAQAQFEQHLVACAVCQTAAEAAMQMWALGAALSERRDRPRAVPYLPDRVQPPRARHRGTRRILGAALAIAAIFAIVVFGPDRSTATLESQITAGLMPHRTMLQRLPYAALDRHRAYDPTRSGPARNSKPPPEMLGRPGAEPARGEQIAMATLAELEKRGDSAALIAALIAGGDLVTAERRLQQAGPGDGFDVERAIVAERRGQGAAALALLDQVLARSPRNAQAMWNRAVVLTELDLPLVAAEAFDASAALAEPGWSAEAAARRDDLRRHEAERARQLQEVIGACHELEKGVVPDLGLVRRHASVCRPALYVAVRGATTRDEVLRLVPVARAIDEASGNTASSALVNRIAASDFRARGPSVALYTTLKTPGISIADQARIAERLRASGYSDLVLGALLRMRPLPPGYAAELVRLARDSHDPYLEELATQRDARAKLASGRALEAELSLRRAVKQCAARDVELDCAHLQLALVELYVARHRPTDATQTALVALDRSRRLGLYWDERLLFGFLAEAARFERDYPRMRAYSREAALRDPECAQVSLGQEALADAELTELRFASARAELARSPTCQRPLTLVRARIEAELARFGGTPAQIAELRREFDRSRQAVAMTRGELARLDAIEGRLLAAIDPAAARSALDRAIAAADALGFDDVEGTKARSHAYRTLLLLGAKDLGAPALLELFAAAVRARPRAGCALGALVDGERLLLLARDAGNHFQQVFEPHAFETPDFDVRTLVPAALVAALSRCARVDVFALPPLYGQPQLLPPGLAWSYRGPAGAPQPADARRPSILTIEDARPPAALELPRLPDPSHAPRHIEVDEVVLRGAEATPARLRDELSQADFAEIHAHGFVDLGISDVSLIALSPDLDGSFALTARVIAGLELPRAPFVTLAACDAAYTAPYLHEPWSLPYAFLLAGARGVLAPATVIPDKEAGGFFRAVGDQILRGVDPAVVLRDQRLARQADPTDWVNGVVLFD